MSAVIKRKWTPLIKCYIEHFFNCHKSVQYIDYIEQKRYNTSDEKI